MKIKSRIMCCLMLLSMMVPWLASVPLVGHSIELEPETSAQVEMPKDDAQSQNREENAVIATNPETDCTKMMGGA